MIGNDVVDIVQSRRESNWQRPGFLEKIFNIEEQQLIHDHINKELMVWVLWSMKESAYKIYNRNTGIRGFIPQQLSCSVSHESNNHFCGSVVCNGNLYYTHTIIKDDIIHTIAAANRSDLANIREIENAQIVKDSLGLPYLYNAVNLVLEAVSVSHHGRSHKIIKMFKM